MRVNRGNRFQFLEHTADAYVAAYGKNLTEAFENAALAMFETMTDTDNIKATREDQIEAAAHDEFELLYNWLEALLLRFDTESVLYGKFRITQLGQTTQGYELKAFAYGEKFDPRKHVQKVGVKAITYHRMEIIKKPRCVTVKFILDI